MRGTREMKPVQVNGHDWSRALDTHLLAVSAQMFAGNKAAEVEYADPELGTRKSVAANDYYDLPSASKVTHTVDRDVTFDVDPAKAKAGKPSQGGPESGDQGPTNEYYDLPSASKVTRTMDSADVFDFGQLARMDSEQDGGDAGVTPLDSAPLVLPSFRPTAAQTRHTLDGSTYSTLDRGHATYGSHPRDAGAAATAEGSGYNTVTELLEESGDGDYNAVVAMGDGGESDYNSVVAMGDGAGDDDYIMMNPAVDTASLAAHTPEVGLSPSGSNDPAHPDGPNAVYAAPPPITAHHKATRPLETTADAEGNAYGTLGGDHALYEPPSKVGLDPNVDGYGTLGDHAVYAPPRAVPERDVNSGAYGTLSGEHAVYGGSMASTSSESPPPSKGVPQGYHSPEGVSVPTKVEAPEYSEPAMADGADGVEYAEPSRESVVYESMM